MLSVSEALVKVLGAFQPLAPEVIDFQHSVGRVLAKPIYATLNLPPFTNSSMDGFAVQAADLRTASATSPVTLTVVADIPAGVSPTATVRAGTAARIMTGARMPAGADAVIPVEATDHSRDMAGGLPQRVTIHHSVTSGAYVRQLGEDIRQGAELFAAGRTVGAYDLGLLASCGVSQISVFRKPRVAILSTGDELVGVTEEPASGQIRDSNSYTLAALVTKYGGEAIRLGVARDNLAAVTEKLQAAVSARVDLIISSAGVSVGAYDVVKTAIEQAGTIDFWKVRMRPGKPLVFGQYRGIPYFGLPGNPVSAIVTFELFARPTLLKLGGHTRLDKRLLWAELVEPVSSDGRESYLRAIVSQVDGRYEVRSAGGQGSNIMSALVRANALLVVPDGVMELASGANAQVWLLDGTEPLL
jgi:molybdopterin molybdotransferase